MIRNVVTVTNRGMLTIPAKIRKKLKINDGSKIIVSEKDGYIILKPIIDFTKEKNKIFDYEEMVALLNQRKTQKEKDIENENRISF
ncbi:MAG: AbrB/MazE/SpoVT family DNA-binding domain-containing protein [Candidatus Lokiarchaeota archaeon]|nr:AbrB/MazE/SpoVT family DNA-binding domain-containing protein [Candidatus Harpocratesius repetitus]